MNYGVQLHTHKTQACNAQVIAAAAPAIESARKTRGDTLYRYRILLFGFYYRYYVYFRLRVFHLQHTGGASTDAVQKRVLTQWSVSEHSRSVSENSRSVSANARSVFLQMQGQFPQMEMRTVSFCN